MKREKESESTVESAHQCCKIFLGTITQKRAKYIYPIATKLTKGHKIYLIA
jgi:hypothetical protein